MNRAKQQARARKKREKEKRRSEQQEENADPCSAPIAAAPAKWGEPVKVCVKRLDYCDDEEEEEAAGSDITAFEDIVGRCDRHGAALTLETLSGTVAGCIADPSRSKPTPIQAPRAYSCRNSNHASFRS